MTCQFAIYSDFDGVHNIPRSNKTVNAAISTSGSKFLARKSELNWNPEIVSHVNNLHETGHFETIWHTTWNHAGNILKAAKTIGLNPFDRFSPAALDEESTNRKEWTKWKADFIIADQLENPRPFIWIDDKAPTYWEDYVRGNTRERSLIIQTDSEIGLTVRDIIRIIDWSKSV